jgi:anti-sigma regulatory factor (Ser/Thr protein kinase)
VPTVPAAARAARGRRRQGYVRARLTGVMWLGYRKVVEADKIPNGRARQLSLPPKPTSARAAREFVREACHDWSFDEDTCDDAALIANELVANVVDHARTSCVMTVSRDRNGLRIDVADLSPGPIPQPGPIDRTALRGRGLQVVVRLSRAWGVRERPLGKSVWVVLDGE